MSRPPVDPPYAIHTERLVLRCWDPGDVDTLEEAVLASLDHLRPWMPWAHAEPISRDERLGLLRRFRGMFDLGQDFVFGIFDRDGAVVGGTGLHTRAEAGGLEIGYWVRAGRTGIGIASEATAALTRIAFDRCGVERVEIHIEPGNRASIAIPLRLGFVEEALLHGRLEPFPGEERRRDSVLFVLHADAYARGTLPTTPLGAYDVAGRRVI